jgi:uncharacterized protein involved in type VI secretion and phage assembly
MIPLSRATDKCYYGVAAGIVKDVEDPLKLGRIKVSFPWFDESMISEWCRIAQLYAGGGNKGSMFIPDLEDEVVVAFVHGDMREPIILGCVYNLKDAAPSFRDSTRDQKLIRTRTGHQLLLDDSAGKERVSVTSQGGHVVDLDDVARTMSCETPGGRKITLDDTGMSVKIETPDGMSIVMQNGTVTITGTTSVKLDAPKVDITSAATMSVPLGEAMVAAFNAHVHPTAVGPTGSPAPPMIPASVLSLVVKVS